MIFDAIDGPYRPLILTQYSSHNLSIRRYGHFDDDVFRPLAVFSLVLVFRTMGLLVSDFFELFVLRFLANLTTNFYID